jgi:thiamine biosynthesis lipoprotein
MMNTLKTLAASAAVMLCASQGLLAGSLSKLSFTHPAMGTLFRIDLYADTAEHAARAAAAAFRRVDELNAICSDYLPESELTRLCRAGTLPVSKDLFDVIEKAQAIAKVSGGAFDISAGHMTNQWRRAKRKGVLPSAADMAKAKALTGFQMIELDAKSRVVTLTKPGMQLDLGGIAKGYAADAALAVLRAEGIPSAVVAASGDIAVGDAPPGEPEGWDIAVRAFASAEPTDALRHGRLRNCGISTSGDLHQVIEIGGQLYSHIVDPKTGLGLTRRIACSVVARDATTSDALATALCVLGEVEGQQLVKSMPGVVATFATR